MLGYLYGVTDAIVHYTEMNGSVCFRFAMAKERSVHEIICRKCKERRKKCSE